MQVIRLSETSSEGIGFQVNELSKIIEDSKRTHGDICICFRNVKFLHPTIILGISVLKNNYDANGRNCSFQNVSPEIGSYLETIYFPSGIYPDMAPNWKAELERYNDKNYLPIINFPTDRSENSTNFRNAILSCVNELIANKLKVEFTYIAPISYFISELTDNIVDHSGVSRAKLMVQYYPTKEILEICIIDDGKGFLRCYNEAGFNNVLTQKEAIECAIKGKSTKSKERGYGIPSSLNLIIKGMKGKICLITGDGMLMNEVVISYPSEWKGTLLSIKIPKFTNKVNLVDYI